MKYIIIIFIIFGVILPSFGWAQSELKATAPQTVDEAKDFAKAILLRLPDAIKKVWDEEALPIWQAMWEWARPIVEVWREKLLNILGQEVEKRRPDIEQRLQEETKEINPDLWNIWEMFNGLLKRSPLKVPVKTTS